MRGLDRVRLIAAIGSALLVGVVLAGQPLAQSVDVNQQGVDLIIKTAENICKDVPVVATKSGVELSGGAKAEITGLLSKLADMHIDLAGKYINQTEQRAVLEQDLAGAIAHQADCRLTVFTAMQERLIPGVPKSGGAAPTYNNNINGNANTVINGNNNNP